MANHRTVVFITQIQMCLPHHPLPCVFIPRRVKGQKKKRAYPTESRAIELRETVGPRVVVFECLGTNNPDNNE